MDFPFGLEGWSGDALIADELIGAFPSYSYFPVHLNSKGPLYAPERSYRINRCDIHYVAEEARQICEITIEAENAIDRASNDYSRFDRIFFM